MEKEYFLKFWGGAESFITQDLKIEQRNFWFRTLEERDSFEKKIREYQHYGLAIIKKDRILTHKQTVAILNLFYDNKFYQIKHNFGYEYDEELAKFIFMDGNYSCDCNLSLFIKKQCDINFIEMDCGHEIKILNFKIELVE